MEPKKDTCEFCGNEFPYYPMAESSMDVGKKPPHCGRKECIANFDYQQKTRNMQTGEYKDPESIRKL